MKPADRRDHIVRIGAEHFSRDGYDRASMSAIAADAGVTRALVYHYFPGKESLLEAVLRREGAALLAATAPNFEATAAENLSGALHAYLDHFGASEGHLRELYTPHPQSPPVVWEITAANHEVQVARLLESLGRTETPRLRLVLSAWLALVEEAARASSGTDLDRSEVVATCLAALDAMIGLDEETTRRTAGTKEEA